MTENKPNQNPKPKGKESPPLPEPREMPELRQCVRCFAPIKGGGSFCKRCRRWELDRWNARRKSSGH